MAFAKLPLIFLIVSFSSTAYGKAKSKLVNKWSHSDCVRPWQIPQMSIPTLRIPSRPVECHPESDNCPNGRNPVCQYSLKSLKYVCCEDKKDADIPTCPKYHETLLLTCGSNLESACPRGYKCMGSLGDENVKLCCKPNHAITYKEPEHTFRENKIVPRLMPYAPEHELIATFAGLQIKMGQLFDGDHLEQLENPPVMSAGVELHDEKLYTILLIDGTSRAVTWMVANIAAFDGQLEIHKRTKSAVSYQSPDSSDRPVGMHVMVLTLFEQIENWSQKDLARLVADDFTFADLFENSPGILNEKPLAATFYGYSTNKDDRYS